MICQRGVTWGKRQSKQKLKVDVVLGEVVVVAVACSKCYVRYVVMSGSKKRESEESSNT